MAAPGQRASIPVSYTHLSKENARTPQDAITYLCEGNKQFHVRMLNNGNEAWLIYPDHEVSLPKSSSGAGRYSSGAISLVINGDETTLNDGEKIAYTACKAVSYTHLDVYKRQR